MTELRIVIRDFVAESSRADTEQEVTDNRARHRQVKMSCRLFRIASCSYIGSLVAKCISVELWVYNPQLLSCVIL